MMGYSHTVSAAAGWLVLVETGVVQVPDTPTLIVTALACAEHAQCQTARECGKK